MGPSNVGPSEAELSSEVVGSGTNGFASGTSSRGLNSSSDVCSSSSVDADAGATGLSSSVVLSSSGGLSSYVDADSGAKGSFSGAPTLSSVVDKLFIYIYNIYYLDFKIII